MSIVIVGGNDCMACRYKTLCEQYHCRAKVFTQMKGTLQGKIGDPDLLVFFTRTVSHKMVQCAMNAAGPHTKIAHCHSSSMAALKKLLDEHVGAA